MSDQQAAVLARIQAASIDGRLKILRIRQRQFVSLHKALIQHREEFLSVIQSDDGCSSQEAKLIFGSALIELRNHYDALDFDSELQQEYSLAKSKSNEDRRVAFSIAYIIPDSFTMFYGVITALCAALAAGVCVVVELENTLRKMPSLLRHVLSSSLDQDAIGFVSKRAPRQFLAACVVVDQTGKAEPVSSQRLLSSPTLRNIAILDRTGDVKLAAREIVASNIIFNGKSRYAVDLVFVNEFASDDFTTALQLELEASRKEEVQLATGASRSVDKVQMTQGKDCAVLKEEVKSARARVIADVRDGTIVQIQDRQSILMKSKRSSSAIVICRSTSLDDMIDVLNAETECTGSIAALYLFSGCREAKYLSQYIKSQVSFVNHIPAQLIVGPTVPLGHSTDLRRRYTREMFETPSPQVVAGPKSHSVSSILRKADFIDNVARKTLKPTGQSPSGAWGFFEQGIVLGALFYLLPIVGMSTFGVGFAAWKGYQRLTM